MTQPAQPIEILLVEDDDDDARLTCKAFQSDEVPSRITRVENGVEAIEYLCQKGSYQDAPRPDLILLDLNMPLKGGHDVLEFAKQNPATQRTPVVVLTTSDDEKDVELSYRHQANSYVTKPADFTKLRQALATLRDYWCTVVRLPSSC